MAAPRVPQVRGPSSLPILLKRWQGKVAENRKRSSLEIDFRVRTVSYFREMYVHVFAGTVDGTASCFYSQLRLCFLGQPGLYELPPGNTVKDH